MSSSESPDVTVIDDTSRSPPGMRLEFKRIDKIRLPATGEWMICDSTETPRVSETRLKGRYGEYTEYAFLVRRKILQSRGSDVPTITTTILIQSDSLKQALKFVMKDVRNMSWNAHPIKVVPQLLLAFLPRLKVHQSTLDSDEIPAGDGKDHLRFLIDFLETEYASTLRKIANLVSHGEITFDLLWAIFLPQLVVFTSCPTTSEPRAVRLLTIGRYTKWFGTPYWSLTCQYLEANEKFPTVGHQFRLASMSLEIQPFDGVVKIAKLSAYPIEWHPNVDEVRAQLIRRGRKWIDLNGVHHKRYTGVATYRKSMRDETPDGAHYVDSRIMIDRRTFSNAQPDYFRRSALGNSEETSGHDLQADNQVMLASPILYGFSLVDKLWLEFNVEHVDDIQWNDDAFNNIAISPDRKLLVESLVESHSQDQSFDDFVQGKGRGLVINLSGPPGVGKSLTVEATSEHLRKPLYVVSAGDLGTDPSTLDKALTKIFSLAPSWGAVVLIDEADVFLEERSASNIERNAMVAVFLRQIEYFSGVLFLTTNRVQTFDPAFQSRIHLSLHYHDLSRSAREQVWSAFLQKTRNKGHGLQDLTPAELRKLSNRQMNGRQIKNVVKLATTLADHENAALTFDHLVRTMSAAEGYTPEGWFSYVKGLLGYVGL